MVALGLWFDAVKEGGHFQLEGGHGRWGEGSKKNRKRFISPQLKSTKQLQDNPNIPYIYQSLAFSHVYFPSVSHTEIYYTNIFI